jgi:hypothetical protein
MNLQSTESEQSCSLCGVLGGKCVVCLAFCLWLAKGTGYIMKCSFFIGIFILFFDYLGFLCDV